MGKAAWNLDALSAGGMESGRATVEQCGTGKGAAEAPGSQVWLFCCCDDGLLNCCKLQLPVIINENQEGMVTHFLF